MLGGHLQIECKVTKQSKDPCGLHGTICEQKREKVYFIKICAYIHRFVFLWPGCIWKDTQEIG